MDSSGDIDTFGNTRLFQNCPVQYELKSKRRLTSENPDNTLSAF
jgi:hypothetical protein